MANLNQLRDRVDAWLEGTVWPTIVARQQNYYTNRGHYWQGLRTHTITPQHSNSVDADSIPDRLTTHPTDQFEDWVAVFPEWENVAIPATLWIDVYDGPHGEGYVAYLEISFNGVTYQRSRNVGPESSLTHYWEEIVPPEP